MDPASIALISLSASILAWNIWQSYKHGHFKSECVVEFNEIKKNDDKK